MRAYTYIHITRHIQSYTYTHKCKTVSNLFRDSTHPDPASCGNQSVESQ